MRRFFATLTVFVLSTFVPSLYGDVFLLKDGGKIEGEFLNPDDLPPKPYSIRSEGGVELSIERKLIERVRKGEQREAITEYNAFAPFKEDTVANHLEIAEWCRERRLIELWKRHLNRVLELDTDNKTARQLLGHIKGADGSWTSREEMLGDQGLLNVRNSWKSQQQIDVEQYLEKTKKVDTYWTKTIESVRANLNDPKNRTALAALNDPAAGSAITKALFVEPNPDVRMLYIKALGSIGTYASLCEIARWTLDPRETNNEVRQTCFDVLRQHPEAKPAIIGLYVQMLKAEKGVVMLNRAAYAIGQLDGRSAIPKLIDVLETTHTRMETVKSQGNVGTSSGGGSASGGLTWGESKVKVSSNSLNTDVRDALKLLTGVDFEYNKDAWRAWLIQSRKTPAFDPRRG